MSCLYCLSVFSGPGCKSADQAKKCGNFMADGHDPKWADQVEADGDESAAEWEEITSLAWAE
jgi:hypothetical protein